MARRLCAPSRGGGGAGGHGDDHGDGARRERRRPARRGRDGERGVPDRRPAGASQRRGGHLPVRQPAARSLRPAVRARQDSRPPSAGRSGIHAAFTATVDAALSVGQHEEVVTVEGDSPTVDAEVQPPADRHEPGDPRGCPHRPRPLVGGQDRPGRAHHDLRRGWPPVDAAERHERPRLARRRQDLRRRRPGRELARRSRRLHDAVLRPGHVRRGELPDRGHPCRGAGGRHLHQHGHEGRGQPVAGRASRVLRERGHPERQQPDRGAEAPRLHRRQPDRADLRPQRLGRRRPREGPAVVQRAPTATGASTGSRWAPATRTALRRWTTTASPTTPGSWSGRSRTRSGSRARTTTTSRSGTTGATRRRTSSRTRPRCCRTTRRTPSSSSTRSPAARSSSHPAWAGCSA